VPLPYILPENGYFSYPDLWEGLVILCVNRGFLWYITAVDGKKLVAIVLIFAGLGVVASFAVSTFLKNRNPSAGLKIETTPPVLIFVNNVQIGASPLEKSFPAGEVAIKLIPNAPGATLSPYQTKVNLTNNTLTVIKRDFGTTDALSAGEIVSLQPHTSSTAGLNVVTSGPDSAAVMIDGQPHGFTPLSLPSVAAGDHQIMVSAPGFSPRTISAQAVTGYKLTLNVKLAALDAGSTPSASPTVSLTPSGSPSVTPRPSVSISPTPAISRPYVKISSTPTGFLRVRSSPSTGASEVGQVKPGELLPLLDSTTSGWYQIKVQLAATSSGWISSQYAQKFE